MDKAIVTKAADAKLAVFMAETFKYVPGECMSAALDHHEILVGSKAFLAEHEVMVSGVSANANDSLENPRRLEREIRRSNRNCRQVKSARDAVPSMFPVALKEPRKAETLH